MSELKDLSLREIIGLIKSRDVASREVWEYFQNRIKELDPTIQAFNYVHTEYHEHDINSPFAGAPIAVKDVYNETGRPTTASSKMLENYISPYESTVTKNLKRAGAQSIGKVNCDEFAMGSTGENSAFRVTKNPWDITRVPGGSSSGSAAAVASRMVPVALGTDTGGSIRQPAGLSGVVGFKGTYGRVSRYGVIPMASSFDTMGVFARNVQDCAFVWQYMVGLDPMDATSLDTSYDIRPQIWESEDLRGLRIGVPKEYFMEGLDTATKHHTARAIQQLQSLGAEIREISLPLTQYAVSAYYILVPSEASTNLGRYDGIRYGHTTSQEYSDYADFISKSRTEGFGPEPTRRIMIGSHTLSAGFYDAYYKKAAFVRQMVRDEFATVFEQVDVMVSPVSPTVAWPIGEHANDPLALYLADMFTIPGALAGLPGISVPCGYGSPDNQPDTILPVGLQITGPQLGEEKVLHVAHVFEKSIYEDISRHQPAIS